MRLSCQNLMLSSFLALCCLNIHFSEAQTTNVVHIATGNWPPFTGKDLPNQGCVNKLITDIFAQEDYQVRFTYMPWRRGYLEAKKGNFDAASYWYDSAERRTDFLFPDDPMTIERSFFYFPKSKPFVWEDFSAMASRIIVVNNGFTYSEEFEQALIDYNVPQITATYIEQNYQLLLAGRADLTVIAERPGEELLKLLPKQDREFFTRSDKPAIMYRGYLLINLKRADLLRTYNRGFLKLKTNKSYIEQYEKTCSYLK
ncbi:substrate-binding periplasmic protein [Thalassotalea fusca]